MTRAARPSCASRSSRPSRIRTVPWRLLPARGMCRRYAPHTASLPTGRWCEVCPSSRRRQPGFRGPRPVSPWRAATGRALHRRAGTDTCGRNTTNAVDARPRQSWPPLGRPGLPPCCGRKANELAPLRSSRRSDCRSRLPACAAMRHRGLRRCATPRSPPFATARRRRFGSSRRGSSSAMGSARSMTPFRKCRSLPTLCVGNGRPALSPKPWNRKSRLICAARRGCSSPYCCTGSI
jgi:hypothetical protein